MGILVGCIMKYMKLFKFQIHSMFISFDILKYLILKPLVSVRYDFCYYKEELKPTVNRIIIIDFVFALFFEGKSNILIVFLYGVE